MFSQLYTYITAAIFVFVINTYSFSQLKEENIDYNHVNTVKEYKNLGKLNHGFDKDKTYRFEQTFKMGLSNLNGYPLSFYSYTNGFSFQLIEGLIGDANLHGTYIPFSYSSTSIPSKFYLSFDSGLKYYPMNNGVFNVEARTYHGPFGSGQTLDIDILGFTIKRLYQSKKPGRFLKDPSFSDY